MSFVDGQVRVRVPATSANLGPGFDSLGLALTLFDELAVEVTDSGLEIVVDGEGAGVVPTGEDNLLFQAMSAAFDLMGETPPGLRLECTNRIPHATPTRPGLCRRLHRWLRRTVLTTHLANLEDAKRDLQRLMAMDQAATLAHRLQYTKSPVLQERMRREQEEFAKLSLAIGEAKAELAELDLQV